MKNFPFIPTSFAYYLVLSSISIPLWWSCNSGGATDLDTTQSKAAVKKVLTVAADEGKFRTTVTATGQLASKEEARLSFKTGGIIRRILVQEGQVVKKDQLLAELDLDEIEAQAQQSRLGVKQARVQVENAQLGLEKAQRDYDNIKGLFEDSVATEEQLKDTWTILNNAINQVDAAEAGFKFAEKSVEVAEFNLRYSKIIAPSRGTILAKRAEVNELAAPGREIFLFGSNEKAKVIRVNITDKDIIYIALRDSASIQFDAYPDHAFQGIVREVSSKADPYTNTFEVEVEVLPEGRKLLSGFIGKVMIKTQHLDPVVRIPIDALISADGNEGVIYVEKNSRVRARRIRILQIQESYLLVQSGIEPGDQVVVEGGSYLEENDSVLIGGR